jgi:hypothetical protein
MPMPTLVAVGAVAAVATGACSPGLPAGWAADDIHLLFSEAANEPLNTITGFTRIGSTAVVQSAGLVTDLSAFWRRAVAGDTAPSITSTPQNHLIARIVGVRGATTAGSPINIFNTGLDNTTGTTFSIPGATTTAANCLIFAALSTGTDANSTTMASGWTNTNLTSITEDIDNWTNLGNGGGIAVAHGDKVTPGAYGATTGSVTTGNTKAFISFAVQGVGPAGDQFSYVAGMRGNGPLY